MTQTTARTVVTSSLVSIETSPNDDRSYRLMKLPNQLECLLIHDLETDKAAASLSMGVGHLSDPNDMPGCAHFCEHLLFLGTKEFPDSLSFKRFLAANAGSSNASTSMDETNYHFTVAPAQLNEALERHSSFFREPLFDPACVERGNAFPFIASHTYCVLMYHTG